MKLVPTRRTDYGIRALLYLAQQQGGPSKAGEISEAMEIPTGFLHQVMQELQRSGLVTSRPGRTGGYSLAIAPEDITVRRIVEALEGPLEAQECALRGGPCRWQDVCALHWVWSGAQQALVTALDAATLAQVVADDRDLASGAKQAPAESHRRRQQKAEPAQRRTRPTVG